MGHSIILSTGQLKRRAALHIKEHMLVHAALHIKELMDGWYMEKHNIYLGPFCQELCPKKFLLKGTISHNFKFLTFSQEIL